VRQTRLSVRRGAGAWRWSQATGGSGQVVLDGIGHLTNIDYSAPAPISLWVVLQAGGIVYNYKDDTTNHFSRGLITAVLHPGSADEGLASRCQARDRRGSRWFRV